MKKYQKKFMIIIIILFFTMICFVLKNIALPAYHDAVINITKREASGDISIELTEQEKKELYAILRDIKGIYMPSMFGEYLAHGRTIYEISIYSKTKGDDFRFVILFDYDNQPRVSVKNILKDSYKKIINSEDLVDFLKAL